MRVPGAILVVGLCLATMLACSRTKLPTSRWEGSYESADVMVVARLEIDSKGQIFLSAPDEMGIGAVSADDRQALRKRLADGLAAAWGVAEPRVFDFDGRVFRKPGGIAPQLEWNPDENRMTAIIYLGLRPSIRIPLHAVAAFSDNPWPA